MHLSVKLYLLLIYSAAAKINVSIVEEIGIIHVCDNR